MNAQYTRDTSAGSNGRTVLCDWGGSRLRAYLQVDGEIIAQCEGPGIGSLRGPAITALRDALKPWRAAGGIDQIVMCGMVGSRGGIVEVPYVQAPLGFAEWASRGLKHPADDMPLLIAAGIRGTNAAGAPDVMRGEETQIFGAIDCDAALARGSRTLLLPGTHSKWVEITEGRIMSLQTYVTGELFALLRDHSSLLRAGDSREPGAHGFAEGLARSRHSGLASALFETRAAQLTLARSLTWAQQFLSGLLIGDEVSAALRMRSPNSVVVVGDSALAALYREALSAHGVAVDCRDGDHCVVAGLRLLAAQHRQAH
jgi:2-dehydro-3-deoxygalactonokinase